MKVYHGTYRGKGTSDVSVHECGFRVKSLRIMREDVPTTAGEWHQGLGDAAALKEVAGTRSAITANGITALNMMSGFDVGQDADLNAANGIYHYVAIG